MKILGYNGEVTFCPNVIPSGTIDGANTSFVLPDVPVANTLKVYSDGSAISSEDYTLTKSALEMNDAPAGSLVCDYFIPNIQ